VPLRFLAKEGASFSTLFDNPNIQPAEEYERRLATFRSFAEAVGVELREGAYEPDVWESATKPYAGVYPLLDEDASREAALHRRMARCRACYACRFERLALRAAQDGFSSIATTLSISPWQFTDIIAEELLVAAKRHGLSSAFVDYREYFAESVKESRERGMYRQNYCGCFWSKEEAEIERQARKGKSNHARK
jgi:predicted adenine nucleotide alpha hydrolase (AANH) superfamily ATPase